MNKDAKVLLMALAILIVGLVSFNFGDLTEDLTDNIQHEINTKNVSSVFTNNNCDVWICYSNYGCDRFKDDNCREKK